MLKEHDTVFRQLLLAVDLLVISAAFFLAYYLRSGITSLHAAGNFPRMFPLETYLGLLPVILALWGGALHSIGGYKHFRGRTLSDVLLDVAKASLISTLLFTGLAYFLKFHYLSRLFIFTVFLLSGLSIALERSAILMFLETIRRKGMNFRHLLIVGTGARPQSFMKLVEQHPEWGFRIIGLVDDEDDLVGKEIHGHRVLGKLMDLPKLLEEFVVDEVVFIVPRSWLGKIESPILYCEQVGKRVSLALDLFSLQFAKAIQSGLHDFPLLMFQTTSDQFLQLAIKRFLDIVLSGIALILLLPFFMVIAILIKVSSHGPVFFRQIRCSLNGRVFTLYKFRTMVPDAEARLEQLRKHNEMSGPAFKMSKDPRMIKPGRWLRKFSIDELPQLWNVFKGDMSFVGPRPPIPVEVQKYQPWQRRRLSMRPGLTCIWQIKGRNKIVDFDDWMRMDLEYIDHWSLWLDLKIFLKTIPIVLFGIGAK